VRFTRPFIEIDPEDIGRAGGKGASLASLTKAGFPVPEGFIIFSDAFDITIAMNGLCDPVAKLLSHATELSPNALNDRCFELRQLIFDATVPREIDEEISRGFGTLNSVFVAVRSSATSEDSASEAWAGQLESFLFTPQHELLSNVKRCWASLYTPHAITYRMHAGALQRPISVAVVVQSMIASEVAGVCFSIHPTDPDRGRMLVEACSGLGEALVSGQITPSTYVIDRQTLNVVERHERLQERAIHSAGPKGGTSWYSLQPNSSRQLISDSAATQLAGLALKIEDHFTYPCDIEWSMREGTIAILQARPITTESYSRSEISSPKFVKTFARDFALISLEIAYQCETAPVKNWSLPNPNPYSPHLAFERADGTVYVWYKSEGISWIEATLRQRISADPRYLELVAARVLAETESMRPFYERPRPVSTEQLLRYIRQYMSAYDWLEALWTISRMPEATGHGSILIGVRKHTAKLSSGSDSLVRQSLSALYPSLGDLSAMISLREFESNSIPSREVLEQRMRTSFYFNGQIHVGMSRTVASKTFGVTFIEDALPSDESTIIGMTGAPGRARGAVCRVMGHGDFGKIKPGQILVSPMTMPDFIREMDLAAAVVTDEGGTTSHAAITAREQKKPCVVGTKVATKLLADGDVVDVDADRGTVRVISRA
jgi:phosphohistidine swiveling domain-containing protein